MSLSIAPARARAWLRLSFDQRDCPGQIRECPEALVGLDAGFSGDADQQCALLNARRVRIRQEPSDCALFGGSGRPTRCSSPVTASIRGVARTDHFVCWPPRRDLRHSPRCSAGLGVESPRPRKGKSVKRSQGERRQRRWPLESEDRRWQAAEAVGKKPVVVPHSARCLPAVDARRGCLESGTPCCSGGLGIRVSDSKPRTVRDSRASTVHLPPDHQRTSARTAASAFGRLDS